MSESVATHPVQTNWRSEQAVAPQVVTMKAYEVYCQVFAPQEAMVTGGCRGGFAASELIALLYASSFPKDQWSNRVNEAFKGMKNL